ncbi:unnamed protein product [Urochloa decumbens]|uniref:Uncharacterized protein n=1 Tax=Urochloa decumbens TaxID=240449 RepID=A0ABC9B029_9POAL
MEPLSIADGGWGISAASWFISLTISKLLDKCFSYLGFPSSEKAQELQRKILQLKLMLEAAEECPQRPRLEQWTKELKSAFYEAEDILDTIDYHHLESRVPYQALSRTQQDGETVPGFNVPIELRIELEASLNNLETLIDEGHKVLSLLGLPASCDCINNTVRTPMRTSTPSVVFGRDAEIDMIRKMLRDAPADDSKCYSVIGIHGVPGSGKTTVAQYVCDKEKDDDYFDFIMWIHVSQNFNVETIFTEMLEIVSSGRKRLFTYIDMLRIRRELVEKLRGKRFLLVLDDFWDDENARKLNLLLSPLKVGVMGSRILVTTRTADAVKALGAQNLVAISDLDEEQFFSMFMHYALDARTVAGQLKLRLDIDFWTRTMNNDMLNNGTFAILWWSYQQLEDHIKQCFTYCSIFPITYKLQRDELVHLWMAEGFVKTTNETEDMEDVGHDYFNVLLSTSFIHLKQKEFGKEYFTIHDLLHDLATRVAGSNCFRIEEGMVGKIPKDVQHLFILSYDERVFREEILNLKSLRTLIMSSSSNKSMNVEDFRSMQKNLKKLRVVLAEVDSFPTISPCIRQQKHLRYLGLFGTMPIITLPRQFTELYHLQKFAVRCTTYVNSCFKDEIANLVNLRYMICPGFYCPNIRRLILLRTLPIFMVRKTRGYEIQQLEHLDNLCGNLSIGGLENVESKEEACQAKLANKVHLSDLVLQWNSHQKSDSQEEVFEALRPPLLVTSLKIKNYNGSTYPSWFSTEKGALENLQHLELSTCKAPPTIGESFLHLHTLVISDCRWSSLPENVECLTFLEKLVIMRCSNIRHLPLLPQSLKVLTLVSWKGSLLPENMERLNSLGELALQNCDNIQSLPSLPLSLKKLEIYNCNRSLTETCQTDGHPNWQKIAHIKEQRISHL